MPSLPPILWMPVFTAGPEDRRNLLNALAVIGRDDPAVLVRTWTDAEEVLYSGTSVEHLRRTFETITDEYRVPAWVGQPQVRYLETIRQSAEGEGKYMRQSGGRGNYAHVKLRLEPNRRGEGWGFVNNIRDGVVPQQYIQPIEHGIQEAAKGGVLGGYEMVDLRATLCGGSYHELDSNDIAFQIAASIAFREAARKASPVIIEPVMAVVLTLPEARAGAAMADINVCRGRVESISQARGLLTIHAKVPLQEMLSWRGTGSHVMLFSNYEPVPRHGNGGEASAGVRRPIGPEPKSDAEAVDPNSDWT